MKIYTEVALAEWCLPIEAVFWLAFGRPPEASYETWKNYSGEYEQIDIRLHPEHVGRGGPDAVDYPRPEEIELLGLTVDSSRYYNGIYGTEDREQIEKIIRSLEERGEDVSDYHLTRRQEALDCEYAQSLVSILQPLIDEAKAEIFLATFAGKIRGMAFFWKDEEYRQHELRDVPKESWTLLKMETFYTDDEPWDSPKSLYLSVPDLLKEFPRPKGIIPHDGGDPRFASMILADGENHVAPSGRMPRGRPPKGGDLLRMAALIEARRRKKSANWPIKTTAQEAEIMQYCQEVGVPISRSTAQRWLKELP